MCFFALVKYLWRYLFQRNTLPLHKANCNTFPISDILQTDIDTATFLLCDDVLKKRCNILDICYANSTRSCCFTKAYGRYVEGTGSVFTNKTEKDVSIVYSRLADYDVNSKEFLPLIRSLNLRFFTPKEVSKLMGFSGTFDFPNAVTDKQKYMLLGNSINVKVVSELIKLLCK